MVSDPVTQIITVDNSQALAIMAETDAKMDEQTGEWIEKRREIVKGLAQVNLAINLTIQSYRFVSKLLGNIVGPIESALLGIIQSAVSTIIAMAAAFSATGFGAVAGAIMASIALSMSFVAFGDVARQFNGIKGIVANIAKRVESAESQGGRTSHAFRTGGL